MPVVAIVDGVLIMFFFNDHDPPHFHVEYAEFHARVRIDTLQIIDGALPVAKRRKVLDWARRHQDDLKRVWTEVRKERKARRIKG